jgi:Rps23 Pro-64 3,4-dihydroxylase Tpa1-like proline 4-hydroxylase
MHVRDNVAMPQAPHLVVPNFLSAEDHSNLLRWTLENESSFVAARVHTGVDDKLRRALVMQDIGPFKMPLAKAASSQYRGWLTQMNLPHFDVSGMELELAAHNDGAHFTRHTDTQTVMGQGSHRALSAVYYFHREPKRFTGGQLRLFSANDETYTDIEPTQNTLAVFPSFVPHQVMPIACPSQDFADSRFAINCWLHVRTRAATV